MTVGSRALLRAPRPAARLWKENACSRTFSFLLWSRAFQSESPRVSTDSYSVGVTAHQRGYCPVLLLLFWRHAASSSFCGHAATSPGRFSTFSERAILKEQSKRAPWATLRLFKDGVLLACLWMWLLPGSIWWSRTLCLVLGLSACWNSARGWVMFSLWQYDHHNIAIQRPPHQIRGCPPCHSPF